MTRTEGWLAGMQLIALALQQDQARSPEMLTYASGSQRYDWGYFTEEVLRQQSECLQRFLLVTSLLDQFCAPLCDVLWEKGQSHQMLALLERKHLVVSMDEEGTWYRRYHHLFTDVLHYCLRHVLSSEAINELYGKVSVWYAAQGQTHEAIHYAVLERDWQRVTTLLEHSIPYLHWRPGFGGVRSMQRWIEQLPAHVFYAYPRIGLFTAWLCICLGDLGNSDAWLDRVESALTQMSEGNERRHLLAELFGQRAMIKGLYGQVDEVMVLCEQGRQLLHEDNHSVRALLQSAQAFALFASGEPRTAWDALQDSAYLYRQGGDCSLFCVVRGFILSFVVRTREAG